MIWRVEILAVPTGREDKSLTNELALWVLRDGDGVATGARSTTNESVLASRGPTAMADVRELDLACVGVGCCTDEHAKALLECSSLAAGDIVDVETTIVD